MDDVFEDTYTKLEEADFLTDDEREALETITKVKGGDYADYILKVKKNSLACAVKTQDLKHNLRDRGSKESTEKIKTYEWSLKTLEYK